MSRKGNRGQPQIPQQLATAKPAMYIEVQVAGIEGGQIYPVNVARSLHDELGMALASLDAPTLTVVPDDDAEVPETSAQSQSETPDDQDPQASDGALAAADGHAHPDA